MAKSPSIRVTPNVKKCLKILDEAVKALPAGDLKKRSEGALDYLSRTCKGERQPLRGYSCPPNKLVIER